MAATDADDKAEMRRAGPEGSGRKPREQGLGVSIATARSQPSPPEVEVRLMEEIVSRANMMTAYHRVMANKGAAGIDRMTVEQLQPHLTAPRAGRALASTVRTLTPILRGWLQYFCLAEAKGGVRGA